MPAQAEAAAIISQMRQLIDPRPEAWHALAAAAATREAEEDWARKGRRR